MGLSPGDRVDRYEVIELLGRGGMGEVYRARDPKLARLVALKVLNVEHGPGTDGAARLLREARAAAALSHSNVLAVFDVGEVQEPEALRGVAYIAMELVVGQSMRAHIGDEGVPIERRIGWLRDVAQALAAAHEAGIVHRDVKPENVMIRLDGAVKVLDFGIARRAKGAFDAWSSIEGHNLSTADLGFAVAGPATLTGGVAGTPLYMAPEQLRGEELDGRADQFAWGVMAYELLTGRSPWAAGTAGLFEASVLFSRILFLDPPAPREVDPRIPESISQAIAKALAKAREARFESMGELVAALEAKGGADEPAASTRHVPSVREGVAERPERGRLRWTLAALGLVSVIGIGTALTMRRAPARVAPVVVAEVQSQMSSNPEATAAYNAGVQAYRDASLGPAIKLLGRAVELDPLFAVAHLRLAVAKVVNNWQITTADLQPVRDSRASLGDRDRALLDALEPWVLEQPNLNESERRFDAAVQRFPGDSDLAFERTLLLHTMGKGRIALESIEAVLKMSPGLAVALLEKGELLVMLGDEGGALESYAQCAKVSPGTTTCLDDMATLEANEGKCEELVATSRRLIAHAPTYPFPYRWLAQGLIGSGEPADAVSAALQQELERVPTDEQRATKLTTDANLAVLKGDFVGGLRAYEESEKVALHGFDSDIRFSLLYPQMLIDLEIGRRASALELAQRYLREKTALTGNTYDALRAYEIELDAGGISVSRFRELRDQWLTEWLAQNPGADVADRWLTIATDTPEDARAALAAKRDGPHVSFLFLTPEIAEPIGRTYLLAGETDEGIRYLTAASSSCSLIDGPRALFSTLAAFDLGVALQARGERAGACGAFARVLRRWGTAGHVSRTATSAQEHIATLGCAR